MRFVYILSLDEHPLAGNVSTQRKVLHNGTQGNTCPTMRRALRQLSRLEWFYLTRNTGFTEFIQKTLNKKQYQYQTAAATLWRGESI